MQKILLVGLAIGMSYFVYNTERHETQAHEMLTIDGVKAMMDVSLYCDEFHSDLMNHTQQIENTLFSKRNMDSTLWARVRVAKMNVVAKYASEKVDSVPSKRLCEDILFEFMAINYGGRDMAGEEYGITDKQIIDAVLSSINDAQFLNKLHALQEK